MDQLKLTFFDECSEALQQIEAGLTEMQDGTSTDDTINAIFRSVHSVKGGAGIFGFEDLVNFAHVLETVLDTMRNGKLTATHEIMDVLLQANDVLSDLITMSRSGEAIPPNHGSECRAALERLIGLEPSADDEERRRPTSKGSISCRCGWTISTRPTPETACTRLASSSGRSPRC